jgi:hypothetical protein
MTKERKGHPSGGEEHRRHAPSRPGHGDTEGGKHAGHRAPPHGRDQEEEPPRQRDADWPPMERSPADELAPDND